MSIKYFDLCDTNSVPTIEALKIDELYIAMKIASRTCKQEDLFLVEMQTENEIKFVSCTFINCMGVREIVRIHPNDILEHVDHYSKNDCMLIYISL